MAKTKKILSVILTVAMLISMFAMPVNAAVTKVITEKAGVTYEYDLAKLLESALAKATGLPSPMYDHYLANNDVKMVYDDVKGYVNFEKVLDEALAAAAEGRPFNLDAYTETAPAGAIAPTPTNVKVVKEDGTVDGEVPPTGDLEVISISAIDANTISVTFDNEETVEIELEEALVHGQTEVTFVYEEVEYTAELTEAWVDEAVVIEEAAEEAVAAYEAATITTFDNVAVAAELKETAEAAVALVEDEEVVEALEARIADQEEALQEIVDAKLEAVNKAANQVTLLSALEFFNNVDEELIADYRNDLGVGNEKDTVAEVQEEINRINVVGDVLAATTQVQLLNALNEGQDLGVFEGVREDYIVTYATGIIGQGLTTAQDIQDVIDGAADAVVSAATTAVENAEAAPTNDALIATAEEEVANVPADLVNEDEESYRELLEARVADVKVVNDVLAAQAVSQVRLLNSLKANGFERIVDDLIGAYNTSVAGETTVEGIQNAIDVANATAVVDALFDGVVLAEGVDQAKIDAAKTMVEALKEKEIDVTALEGQLEQAQDLLDAANALEAATEAVNALFVDPKAEELELALGVDQDAIDAAQDLVKEVTDGGEKTKLKDLIEEAERLLAEFAIELNGQFATMGADTSLGNVRGYTVGFALKGEYKMKDLTNVVMNVYKGDDLLATVTATDKFFSTEEGGLGETNNQSAPFDVFGDFDYVEDGYWNYSGWQGELLDFPTKVEILVTYENGRTAKLTSTTLIEDKWGSIGLLFDAFFVENVNRAETVDEMNAALLALVENGNNDYLNVPGADRLFVANEILEARNEATDKEFENYDALTTALTNALETRTEALDGVNNTLNADSKISDVIDVLEAVSAEFAEMTNAEKADIAEAFFLGLEFVEEAEDGEPTLKTPFRTLAAVKAAAGL